MFIIHYRAECCKISADFSLAYRNKSDLMWWFMNRFCSWERLQGFEGCYGTLCKHSHDPFYIILLGRSSVERRVNTKEGKVAFLPTWFRSSLRELVDCLDSWLRWIAILRVSSAAAFHYVTTSTVSRAQLSLAPHNTCARIVARLIFADQLIFSTLSVSPILG